MTRRTRRGLRAALLVLGVPVLFVPLAAVATAKVPSTVPLARIVAPQVAIPSAVTKTNWWYDDPSALVAPVTAPPATPTTVPKGDLGVGYRNGLPPNALPVPIAYPAAEADKQAFVSVDLGAVPAGASVTSFSLRVPVDTAGDPVSAIDLLNPAGPPVLIACPAVRAWDPGAGPTRWDSLPATDCSSPVKGVFDGATSTYTFSSAALAQGWLDDTNDGLAILPDPKTTAGFTLSLAPASQMKVTLAVDAPAPTTAAPASSPPAAPAIARASSAAPPAAVGAVPPVDVGTVTAPEQAAPAPPVAAPQVASGVAAAPQAVAPEPLALSTTTGEPTWVWVLGGIGTAALLAALSLSLGAPPPAPASARTRIPVRGAPR